METRNPKAHQPHQDSSILRKEEFIRRQKPKNFFMGYPNRNNEEKQKPEMKKKKK